MKKKTKKKTPSKDYRLTSFILLTITFFSFFAIRPSITLILSLQKEKTEYEKINQVLENKIQNIIAAQTKYMEVLNKKDLIAEVVPNSPEIEEVQKLLNTDLEVSSFSIGQIQIKPALKTGLNTITINLSAVTNYQDLNKFVNYISKSRRLYTINDLSISKEDSATKSALLNLTTNLNTYYYLEKL